MQSIIRNTYCKHLIMKPISANAFYHLTKYYSFGKCKLTVLNKIVNNEMIKRLSALNYHTINLSNCKNITDNSVKTLRKCHTLDLNNCT